jgi:exosortase
VEDTQPLPKQEQFLLPLALLFAATLYWTVMPKLVHDWWDDPNFSHGFLVPLFSAWLIWERRAELRAFASKGTLLPGIFLVLIGVAMLVVGKAGGEYFTMRSSLVFVTGGLFWIVFGEEGFRLCLFPLAFLFFMVPIPYILYDAIAFPLKMIASWFGEHSLNLVGVPVFREGNIMFLPNLQLEVADACSGIRSLMSLMALATAAAYFMSLGVARGGVLFLSAIPISIATNSLRIFVTGVLSYKFGQKAAEGFFHEFSGWVVFLAGAFLIVGAGLLLRKKDEEPPTVSDNA